MSNDKKYDRGYEQKTGLKAFSLEENSINQPFKGDIIQDNDNNGKINVKNSQWNFLNNHLNKIIRRKTMLDCIVNLNKDYKDYNEKRHVKDNTSQFNYEIDSDGVSDNDFDSNIDSDFDNDSVDESINESINESVNESEKSEFSVNNFLSGDFQNSDHNDQSFKPKKTGYNQQNLSEENNEHSQLESYSTKVNHDGNSRFIRSRIAKVLSEQNDQLNGYEQNPMDTDNISSAFYPTPYREQNFLYEPRMPYYGEFREFHKDYKNFNYNQKLNQKNIGFLNNGQYEESIKDITLIENLERQKIEERNIKNFIEENGSELFEILHNIKDKAKNDIIHLMLDGEWHNERELLRLAKKSRYCGTVSFGIMMLSFGKTISDRFVTKKRMNVGTYYKINDNFMGLARAACSNYKKNLF
ncbi:MAG: hypothetical protein ACTSWY_07995 [Promethearchaeota archaeon]